MLLSTIIYSLPLISLVTGFPAPVEPIAGAVAETVPMPIRPIDNEKITFDFDKMYEPNPFATNFVEFTVEYTDKITGLKKEHEIGMELYGTVVPITVSNFALFASGVRVILKQKTPTLVKASYKGTNIDQIIPNQRIHGGAILKEYGSLSAFGNTLPDENFMLKHDRPGRVSMFNTGPDTNKASFFITTGQEPQAEYDSKYVVFGQVTRGLDFLLNEFQYFDTDDTNYPKDEIVIKYSVGEAPMRSDLTAKHTEYEKNLESFRKGDTSKGITLRQMMESPFPIQSSAKDPKIEEKATYNKQLNKESTKSDFNKRLFQIFVFVIIVSSLATSASKYAELFSDSNSRSLSMKSN